MYSGVYSTVHIATSGQFSLVRDIYVLVLAKIFKIKSVIHMRIGSLPTVVSGHSLYSFAVSIAVKLASVVIVIDKKTLMALSRRCPGARIEYIPNCIDLSDIENSRFLKEKVVLFVGWVIKSKGVEELLHAWMIARRDGWNLNVVGPLDSEYMSLLKERYGLDKVSFSGELPHKDVLRLMDSSSIFVLPSHTEGFPNVLLEAMSSQCAVVATDVGAIPEMLSDGCGLLVKVGDSDSLSQSLTRLMNDDDFRLELAVNGRKRVAERYDIQQIFPKYKNIWIN
jgi:glycosyltransferase involved in cell wall biosynthesis